jgi:Zn-dependent protease with chaperone function
METDVVDPFTLLQGLGILTAIPVVGLALWSQYFLQYIEELKENEPDFDPADEVQKIRLASLTAMLAQLVLFMGSTQTRKLYPIVTTLFFGLAIFLQVSQQTSVESKLMSDRRKKSQSPDPSVQFAMITKAFLWSAMGGIAYVGILLISMRTCLFAAQQFHLSTPWTVTLMGTGLALGILGGLGFGFAMGPLQLRKVFPTSPLENGEARKEIEECFNRNRLPAPSLWCINMEGLESHNILIAGFRRGIGPFRPALFVSKSLLGALQKAELQAIILHEISHIKLNHLRDRFLFSSGMIIASSMLAGVAVLLFNLVSPGNGVAPLAGLGTLIAMLIISFRKLAEQSRFHETEADIHAILLGSSIEDFEAALRKIDQLNDVSSQKPERTKGLSPDGHPSTDERIQFLKAYFAKEEKGGNEEDRAA